MESKGLKFVGRDVEGERMEIVELQGMSRACPAGGRVDLARLFVCLFAVSRQFLTLAVDVLQVTHTSWLANSTPSS